MALFAWGQYSSTLSFSAICQRFRRVRARSCTKPECQLQELLNGLFYRPRPLACCRWKWNPNGCAAIVHSTTWFPWFKQLAKTRCRPLMRRSSKRFDRIAVFVSHNEGVRLHVILILPWICEIVGPWTAVTCRRWGIVQRSGFGYPDPCYPLTVVNDGARSLFPSQRLKIFPLFILSVGQMRIRGDRRLLDAEKTVRLHSGSDVSKSLRLWCVSLSYDTQNTSFHVVDLLVVGTITIAFFYVSTPSFSFSFFRLFIFLLLHDPFQLVQPPAPADLVRPQLLKIINDFSVWGCWWSFLCSFIRSDYSAVQLFPSNGWLRFTSNDETTAFVQKSLVATLTRCLFSVLKRGYHENPICSSSGTRIAKIAALRSLRAGSSFKH